MRMRLFVVAVILAAGAWTVRAEGGPIWGWRGDGTGSFPDADPPTEWGPETNVVWKLALPGPSNASPIIVGDRVFVCYDQTPVGRGGGVGVVTGLACVDKNKGTLLWSKTNTLRDVYADEEWEAVKTRRGELAALTRQRGQLDGQIRALNQKYGFRTEKARAKNEERRRTQWQRRAAQLKKQGKPVPPYQAQDYGPLPTAEEIAGMERDLKDLRAQRSAVHQKMSAYQDVAPTHVDGTAGYSTPTPVTDGQHVYVFAATGVVACYDLEGNRRWMANVGPSTIQYGHAASPVLAGDRLVVHINGLKAFDKTTGRLVWTTPIENTYGSPIRARVGGQEVVVTANGELVASSDGRRVARGLGVLNYASPIVSQGTVYFIDGQKAPVAVPLPTDLAGGAAKPLWRARIKGDRYYASTVLHDGILYAINQIGHASAVGAADGTVLWDQKLDIGATVYPSVTAAGRSIFFSSDTGKTAVVEPGRTFRLLRVNSLEPFRSSPVFEGSRMYVRGLKTLYCIGR